MPIQEYPSDAFDSYLSELTARIVAQSGIPSDRFHIGKILLQSFKDAPDFVLHIDGATGETDTFQSALSRSVKCANAFRKLGLKRNDVIIVMAPNHIHLPIPLYACLYLGVAFNGIDMTLKVDELAHIYNNVMPKIIFCQRERADDVDRALKSVNHKCLIITFDDSDRFMSFYELLKSGEDVPVEEFKASDFNPEITYASLVPTSGTSGMPKAAIASHKNWMISLPPFWSVYNTFPTPFKMHITVSPVQWLSATAYFVFSPILRITRLQSSLLMTPEHFYELVNKYKPSSTLGSPNYFMQIYREGCTEKCDLTCIERIMIGGSFTPCSLVDTIKEISPNTTVNVAYGLTELGGISHSCVNSVRNSVGTPLPSLHYRIVDPETQKDINEPNVPGELWVKGPTVFLGYYNNPEMTKQALTEDGWLKTGDILYRDDRWNFYFVERLKMLMKYMNHQISPVEIEAVILKHPGVFDVAVTGIPDEKGELPVACVVRNEGSDVTAQEIKNVVKEALTDSKQLRGGVVFVKELPMTPSCKVNRAKLAAMVREMERL